MENNDKKVLYRKLYKTMTRFDNLVNYFASEKADGNFKKFVNYRAKYYEELEDLLERMEDFIIDFVNIENDCY